jgi:hypothetical protein
VSLRSVHIFIFKSASNDRFFLTQYESFNKKPFLLSEGAIFRVLGTKAGKNCSKSKHI